MAEKANAGIKGGQQWTRVTGANIQPQHAERAKVNKTHFESGTLKQACDNAGIPITKRQASKWANSRGLAYKTHKMIA